MRPPPLKLWRDRSALCLIAGFLSVFGFLTPARAQSTVTPTWYFKDYFNALFPGTKTATITPMTLVGTDPTNAVLAGDPRPFRTTNSAFTATLQNGFAYRVEFDTGYQKYALTNYFGTNVTGSVNGGDPLYRVFPTNLAPNVFAYSMAQSDGRFLAKVLPSTAGYVPIATDALGNYAWGPMTGGGGGAATNVFFYPGNFTGWKLVNGSNVVDLTGSLTNFAKLTTNAFDTAGSATAATNGYPWGSLYDVTGAARAATNGYPWGSLYDAVGTATAATNGYPWGVLYDAAGRATAATNGYPWGVLYDVAGAATAATNGYPWGSLYDAAGAAHAATNGFPWGVLYDAAGAATAATNGLAITSGLSGFVNTNRFAASATTLTLNGTANQITSSAGAQDFSANRVVTLSLPSTMIAPGTFAATGITNSGVYYGNGSGVTNLITGSILTGTNLTLSFNGGEQMFIVTNDGPDIFFTAPLPAYGHTGFLIQPSSGGHVTLHMPYSIKFYLNATNNLATNATLYFDCWNATNYGRILGSILETQ